jgi:tight adherence protein B
VSARRYGALAVIAACVWAASPVAAFAEPSPSPSPSDAGLRGPGLILGGARTTGATLRFYLTPQKLPTGTTLSASTLAVTAEGVTLPATVTPVTGSTDGAAGADSRGVVLVFDAGASMAGLGLDTARDAAAAYAAGLPADVALGLVTVGDRPTAVLAPTTDRIRFYASVNATSVGVGTALYDGVHEADRMLMSRVELTERRIVVLTGSPDTASAASAADVGTELGVDAIRLDAVAFTATDGAAESTLADLSRLAAATGGRLATTGTGDGGAAQLRTAFVGLAAQVSPPVLVTVPVPAYLAGRTVSVQVALAGVAATSISVTFHPDSRVTVALTRAGLHSLPGWVLVVGLGALAGGVLLGGFALTYRGIGRRRMRRRLRELDHFTGSGGKSGHHEEGNAFVRAALAMSDRAVKARGDQGRIEATLEQAAIELRPDEWILLRIVIIVGGAVIAALLLPWAVGLVVGAVAGWLLPEVYRRQRAARRARRFAELLPEALQLVVGALRSGFSLPQAVDALVREGPDPVAGEFSRAVAEVRLGGDLEDALERVAARNDSRDLSWLVMAIRIQREVGGNLSEVMETAVATMRERSQVARHVSALSAEGRLSAYVLIALPVAVAAFMFISRGEYLRPLYTEFFGLCLLGTAAALMAIGAFWLSRLIKVKV